MKKLLLLALAAAVWCAGCSGGSTPETVNDSPKPVATAAKFSDVKEIFASNCIGCHSGSGAKQGIDLSSYEGIMKGGNEGEIVKAGDAEGSKLALALRGKGGMKQMPMKAAPLPEEQIAKVEAWIKAGAKAD